MPRKEKRMSIYFVDFENVRKHGLEGIETLKSTDKVILFHYVGEGNVKYDILSELSKSKAFTQIQRIEKHDKNAMDFEIVAMLGYMLKANGTNVEYKIVSNDKGYLAAIECLKNIEPKANIELVSKIAKTKESLEDMVEAVLNKTRKITNRTIKVMLGSASASELHNNLVQEFKTDGANIYKLVAPIYKEYILCV